MKNFFYLAMLGLAACSPQSRTEATESATSSAEILHQANADSDTVKMTGTVHFSFEQAEFIAQEKHYFILKGYDLISKVQEKRKYGAYNVTLHNVCVQGKVLTKEQNKGNGFGPLGRYNQAVVIESLC